MREITLSLEFMLGIIRGEPGMEAAIRIEF